MDNPGVMRSLLLLAAIAAAASAKGRQHQDEVNPRAPDQPLEISFLDYYCPTCVREERIAPPEKKPDVRLMRMPVAKLAKDLGLKERDRGKKWFVIQTPDFKILSNLKGAKVKPGDSTFITFDLRRLKKIFPKLTIGLQGTVLRPHQRAHLYHIRFARVYAHFKALTGNKEKWFGMEAPYECYLFDEYAEHHRLCDVYVGRTNDKAGVQHHMREKPNYMMFTTADRMVPGGDRTFSNHVIHHLAHNLADGFGNYYRETPAWLEEGLAHYYERRETPKDNTFCWTEGKSPTDFQKPNWRSTILALVRRGKDLPLGQWCEKEQPGALSGTEQGLSWSIVEWMIRTDPVRLAKVLQETQDYTKKPTAAEVLHRAFGITPNTLHERWRKYVKTEYAKKK